MVTDLIICRFVKERERKNKRTKERKERKKRKKKRKEDRKKERKIERKKERITRNNDNDGSSHFDTSLSSAE